MGFARPAVAEEVATEGGVVMLAIDTSLSMEADDVAPSRIDAAQAAAGTFLESVPDGVRIGVVGFDGTAHVLLDPTDDTAAVQRTIDRIQLGEGTAIGEAVFSALDVFTNLGGDDAGDGGNDVITGADSTEPAASDTLTGAVVLLSDGETTQGRSNDEAAKAAKAQGVAVNTIAFGTDSGVVTGPDGIDIPVPVNRDALRSLADETGGRYFPAYTEAELKQVYEKLGESVETETVQREVTDWFTFAAMALALLAGIGSLVWFSRLP
jgi:Ca-activated chloride channel homolog